jgi:hypothetical protein
MFHIEGFVDDKNLAVFMRAVAGLIRGIEVKPVVEVAPAATPTKRTTRPATNGYMELFGDYLAKHPGPVDPNYAKAFLNSIGRTPTSYQHVLMSAIKMKYLKRTGSGPNIRYTNLMAKTSKESLTATGE